MSSSPKQQGPPYAPKMASIGGLPSTLPDVPVSAVLIVIYLAFAATNMTIFQINKRRKYKFFPTLFIFGFCMARVGTLVLRIAWSQREHNIRLAIAANVFVNVGILIIYVLNLVFAHRILKAEQPHIGWKPVVRGILTAFYAGIGAALVMVITSLVLSVYSLNPTTLKSCRDIQLAAITYLFIFTTLPLFMLALAQFLPKPDNRDTFGEGGMTKKKLVILATSCLAVVISGFKTGTAWMPPRPISHPAWYHSKAAFYIFNFTLEITILAILTFTKPHKILYVPDGSRKAGDYTSLQHQSISDEESHQGEVEKEIQ